MRRTDNLGLTQYETSDKFRITDESDSLNKDMQIIDENIKDLQDDAESMYKTQGALAILCNGNVHPSIPQGKYLYIKNHSSLPDGFYISKSYIPENANLASTGYVTAVDAEGCINDLNVAIATLNSNTIHKDKLAIVSGIIRGGGGHTSVNYPEGFNRDNCFVLSCFGDLYGTKYWSSEVAYVRLEPSTIDLYCLGGHSDVQFTIYCVLMKTSY